VNSFGRLFRITLFGESHGPCVGVLIDGCPAGLPLSEPDFYEDLQRRRAGGKGTTQRVEQDLPIIKSGLFQGRTTGAPILVIFENRDVAPEQYEELRYLPRPGHADLVVSRKYGGFNDFRGGGQFSGRLTVGLVAAGVVAKKIIRPLRVMAELKEVYGSKDTEAAIEEAERKGDSVGGIVECKVIEVPPCLGEPFFDTCESLLSHIVFAIPGIKGIEFGRGFQAARMKGSEFNDEPQDLSGRTRTNNCGGILGGMTTGNEVVFRVAVRPTPSIKRVQLTVDTRTGQKSELLIKGRHDVCFAVRIPPIVEAATAIVFADLLLLEQRRGRVYGERD